MNVLIHRSVAALSAAALLLSACAPAAQPTAPTAAPAAKPTEAPKPAAPAATAAPAAKPTEAAKPAAAPTTAPPAASKPTEAAKPAASTEPVTLNFWHGMQGAQERTIKELVEAYKQVRPNVTINLDYTSYSGGALQQKVMASIAANNMPDLVQGFANDTAAWHDAKAVVPLAEYINGSNGITGAELQDVYPSLLREGQFPQFQNQQLSFPFNKSMDGVFVYNVPMLKAAGYDTMPATWEEFEQMCAKVQKPDVQCYAIQPSASRTMIQMYAHGGEVLAPDLKSVAFGPSVEKWFDRQKSLIEKKYAYVVRDFSWQNDFAAGKLAVGATTTAGDSFIRDLVKDSFEYAYAQMPAGPGGTRTFSLSGTNLVIFKSNPAKQQAAWDFIKYVTGKEQTLKWSMATGYLPVRKSAAQDPAYREFLQKNPRFNIIMENVDSAKSEPPLAAWSEIRTFLADAENKVTSLSATPKAATEELVTKSNQALAR